MHCNSVLYQSIVFLRTFIYYLHSTGQAAVYYTTSQKEGKYWPTPIVYFISDFQPTTLSEEQTLPKSHCFFRTALVCRVIWHSLLDLPLHRHQWTKIFYTETNILVEYILHIELVHIFVYHGITEYINDFNLSTVFTEILLQRITKFIV